MQNVKRLWTKYFSYTHEEKRCLNSASTRRVKLIHQAVEFIKQLRFTKRAHRKEGQNWYARLNDCTLQQFYRD